MCATATRSPATNRAGVYHSNGLIDEALLDALTVDGAHYYLCGPEPMLRHVHALLSRRGVPMERVHYEFFGPAAALAA